jgi:transposase-like protein
MASPSLTQPDQSLALTCPLCHTGDTTVTPESVAAGATWKCTTCGQRWSATRLATVAAYAQYVATH